MENLRRLKKWPFLLCLCLLLSGCGHEHVWEKATCSAPKTCNECGKTEGEVLDHVWREATCTEAKTCSSCGKTDGEPLDHEWDAATCLEAKRCSVCGEHEGEKADHQWLPATTEVPETCEVCGETTGMPLITYSKVVQIVKTAYDSAIEYSNEKGFDYDYTYNEVRERLVGLNSAAYLGDDNEVELYAWGLFEEGWESLNTRQLQEKAQDVLEYVIADDGDYLSALMRKFQTTKSVSGTITETEVDIVVEDMDTFVQEMGLKAKLVGGVLSVIKQYDYSWIDDSAPDLLQFTEDGFTFHWKAVGPYALKLS